MNIINQIKESWGWLGVNPSEIIDINKFGNIIFKDTGGKYWRLIPEHPECSIISDNEEGYLNLMQDQDFLTDWQMKNLVETAEAKYGVQNEQTCFFSYYTS